MINLDLMKGPCIDGNGFMQGYSLMLNVLQQWSMLQAFEIMHIEIKRWAKISFYSKTFGGYKATDFQDN